MYSFLTGKGFIGSYLAKAIKGIKHIPHKDIAKVKPQSVKNFYFLSTYGNLIFHTDENKIIQANVLDLVSILKQIDWTKINSFVFLSTSSVKRRIQTFYSRTKKVAEELLLSYMEKYNAPISILRPFTVIGVGEHKEHLIPTLIRSCLKKEEMPFVSEPRHDYIDVEDIVRVILLLSERRMRGIFEAGWGKSYSNQEVKEIVEKITKKKANIRPVSNLRAYDSKEWVSTNFRLRQFGWKPAKTLEQSIKEMYDKQSR